MGLSSISFANIRPSIDSITTELMKFVGKK